MDLATNRSTKRKALVYGVLLVLALGWAGSARLVGPAAASNEVHENKAHAAKWDALPPDVMEAAFKIYDAQGR